MENFIICAISVIASFVEHPVCSIFKGYNTLSFLFWFAPINPMCMCKSEFLLEFHVIR